DISLRAQKTVGHGAKRSSVVWQRLPISINASATAVLSCLINRIAASGYNLGNTVKSLIPQIASRFCRRMGIRRRSDRHPLVSLGTDRWSTSGRLSDGRASKGPDKFKSAYLPVNFGLRFSRIARTA